MINLLERKVRRTLRLSYLLRLVSVTLFLLAAALFIAAVTLIPAYVLALSKKRDAELASATVAEILAKEEREASSAEITELKEKLGVLTTGVREGKTFAAFELLIELRPGGVQLNDLGLSTLEKGSELVIEGTAATRDALLSYQRELQKTNFFSGVMLPVSNLAKENNLDFAITLNFTR